jgi:AcrR family transcriptional regulator
MSAKSYDALTHLPTRIGLMPQPTNKSALKVRKQPRQRRSADTVAVILEAAAHILDKQGSAKFNTNAVAERAGVSIGSLYQYFPGKQALLAALVKADLDQLCADLQRIINVHRTSDLTIALAGLSACVMDHQFNQPQLAIILDHAEINLAMDDHARDALGRVQNLIEDFLTPHLPNLSPPARAGAALDVIGMTRGMIDASVQAGITDRTDIQGRLIQAIQSYIQGRASYSS